MANGDDVLQETASLSSGCSSSRIWDPYVGGRTGLDLYRRRRYGMDEAMPRFLRLSAIIGNPV